MSTERQQDIYEELFSDNTTSPYEELLAHEFLWSELRTTLKDLTERLSRVGWSPKALLNAEGLLFGDQELAEIERFLEPKLGAFSIVHRHSLQYPQRLLDAKYPPDLLYYKGELNLLDSQSVSIVGTRNCTEVGLRRAAKLAKQLVDAGYAIVSGLARGIDTEALTAAMDHGGAVIGVIGTPIDQYYPPENHELQDEIARGHLLVSQVPMYRYEIEAFKSKRRYFPQRNSTMSAISDATVIVEASDKSGTLTQARACLQQGRKLFILNSCFENSDITWPAYYEERGAVRVRDTQTILDALERG